MSERQALISGRTLVQRRLVVLHIEDDPGYARILRRAIEYAADTRVYASISEALQAMGDVSYDVVLLDLGLPDSDGLSGLRRIRAATRAPILILTGSEPTSPHNAVEENSVIAGADDYLQKDAVSAAEIVLRMRLAIARYNRLAIAGGR